MESNNEKLTSLISLTENFVFKSGMTRRGSIFNNMELLNCLISRTNASSTKLMNIVNTLSKLEGTGTSTAGLADGILIVEKLLKLHNKTAAISTCQKIKQQQPYSPSGY